jgi:hypothetical protein
MLVQNAFSFSSHYWCEGSHCAGRDHIGGVARHDCLGTPAGLFALCHVFSTFDHSANKIAR